MYPIMVYNQLEVIHSLSNNKVFMIGLVSLKLEITKITRPLTAPGQIWPYSPRVNVRM